MEKTHDGKKNATKKNAHRKKLYIIKTKNPTTINLTENYLYFWKTVSPFSQWHHSPFADEHGHKFCNTEQYMMYYKALLFNDTVIAEQIIRTKNPKKIKKFGRQVKNFNEDRWKLYREKIVYKGNLLKFIQNKKLEKYILSTKKKILVEASPYDSIWGIGLSESNAKKYPESWGLNLLGKTLMRVRSRLECRTHFKKYYPSDGFT